MIVLFDYCTYLTQLQKKIKLSTCFVLKKIKMYII